MANDALFVTAYHVTDGPSYMYSVDAAAAANQWPKEWKLSPWPVAEEVPALSLSGAAPIEPATVDEAPVIPLKSGK